MTLRTSAVAVCCCNDSRSSLSSRVFSIAMTAWLAKVFKTSSCFSDSGPGASLMTLMVPIAASPRRIGMMVIARLPVARKLRSAARKLGRSVLGVGNVHGLGIENGNAMHVFAGERDRKPAPHRFGAGGIRVGDRRGRDLVLVHERDHDGGVRKQLEPTLHDRVEHGLGVVERLADDAENVS